MKRVLFLDTTCPAPYDSETLKTRPQGGTESTVTRVAEGLAASGYEVFVAQHNRKELGTGNAAYVPFEAIDHFNGGVQAVICLRTPSLIPIARSRFPDARPFLWLHDFNQMDLVRNQDAIQGTGVKVLGVSEAHATHIKDALLRMAPGLEGVTVSYVYNPVDDTLQPDSTPRDPFKLCFFSSPHKGLENTLDVFAKLTAVRPDFRLHVSNPGYLKSAIPGRFDRLPLVNHGSLPHAGVIQQVRESLCVLHLNAVFPETFGLVHAEANAVGTPVITGFGGANSEVLNPAYSQMMDARNVERVIERILMLQKKLLGNEPLQVSCKPEFRLSNVLKVWGGLIG